MIGPFIFLDIDGVLNSHRSHPNNYCGCDSSSVYILNRILAETGAKIVVISAWRYFMLRGEMNLAGFQGLMATHGLTWGTVVDCLGPDNEKNNRAQLIEDWFATSYGLCHDVKYIVLDDMDLGYTEYGMPFVQTDPKGGLGALPQRLIEDIIRRLK